MIGKTIINYRSVTTIELNKDKSLRALVWVLVLALMSFYSKAAFSQPSTAAKVKTKPAAAAKSSKPSAEDVEDTADSEDEDDDTEDSSESTQASDDTAEKPDDGEDSTDTESQATNDEDEESDDDTEELVSEKTQAPAKKQVAKPNPVPTPNPQPEPVREIPIVESEPETPAQEEKVTDADYVEVIPRDSSVEVITRKEYLSYRERRATHGFLFNINAENLYFPDYQSIQDGKLYEELFGQEDLTLAQFHINYKLNFFIGALTAGFGYGQGTLVDDRSLEERTLTISKKSIQAQWLLDSLMREPFFVPYVGFNYWQLELSEKNAVGNISTTYTTGNGTSITAGFLVQMNWLEPETSKLAYLNHGLENTYLDIFWTQYQSTDEELDPNFENDFNFGAGIRVEF